VCQVIDVTRFCAGSLGDFQALKLLLPASSTQSGCSTVSWFMRDCWVRSHLCSGSMKAILCALYFGAFTSGALAGDLIKYQSPDGKFAMLLTEADDQGVSIKLIEAGSRKVLVDLADTGHPYSEHSKLLWSPDSTRFAFFEDNRRGGSTIVYQRSGQAFEEASLPETCDCKNKKNVGKEFGVGVEPKQWINATTLVLLATQEWDDADDPDKTHECKQTIRIVFDSAGKASAKLLKETHG
jgi:hypothetical protein